MKITTESFAGVATSATRVIELYYPEDKRLFDDQFALKLLPFGWRVFFRLLYLPGLRSALCLYVNGGCLVHWERFSVGHVILMTY